MGVHGASIPTATSWSVEQPRICSNGQVPFIVHGLLEANSQSFKAGALVYSNSGAVTIAAVGDVPVLGIALKDATNVTSGNVEIPVLCFNADSEILIQASPNGTTFETANTTCKVGTAYDFNVTNGTFTIDSSDTTNPKMVVVGYVRDVNGDVTTWLKCRPYYLENQPIAG